MWITCDVMDQRVNAWSLPADEEVGWNLMSVLTISFLNSLLLLWKPVEELPFALKPYLADTRNYGIIFWKVPFQFRERLTSIER